MEVDLGQDAVEQQVLELLFVADVVVEGAGDDAQAGGQAAHGQGLDAVVGDDRQRFGDDPLAGELGAAVLVVDGWRRTTATVIRQRPRAGRILPVRACWVRPAVRRYPSFWASLNVDLDIEQLFSIL